MQSPCVCCGSLLQHFLCFSFLLYFTLRLWTFGSLPAMVCSCWFDSTCIRAMSMAFSSVNSDPFWINFSHTLWVLQLISQLFLLNLVELVTCEDFVWFWLNVGFELVIIHCEQLTFIFCEIPCVEYICHFLQPISWDNKTGSRQCSLAVCSTFLYICSWVCSSFEYTLRSTWRLNGLTRAKNAQYNLHVYVYWAYRSWHICYMYVGIYADPSDLSWM